MTAFLRSLSGRVLLALAAGLGLGAGLQAWTVPPEALAATVEAVGGLWLAGLQMTVVPLVFSLLVVGVASVSDAVATGRLAARAVVVFVSLVLAVGVATVAGVQTAFALWPVDPAGAAALVAGAGGSAAPAEAPSFAAWLRSLAPTNPVGAAADSAVLPLVVFAVFFGFAATRLPEAQRRMIVGLFDAIADAMIVIVRWVLWAAPAGVFALALSLGLRGGLGSTGALLHYVLMASLACIAVILVSYPIAVLAGRMPLRRFARGAAPAQVVAFSTQSSLASLPVMVERAVDHLGVPERVAGLVLPLAVAVFRLTSPAANLTVALFIAHVSGVELGLPQLAAGVIVALAVSVSTVGLPGQASFFASMAPICLALGVPLDLLPLLLAVEVIPDIFRTVGNVTSDLAVTVALNRHAPPAAADAEAVTVPPLAGGAAPPLSEGA